MRDKKGQIEVTEGVGILGKEVRGDEGLGKGGDFGGGDDGAARD